MPQSSPIPTGAAGRILRNPHSLPRIPGQLAGVVQLNKRRERIRQYPEEVHQLCRAKVETERSARMVADKYGLLFQYQEAANTSGPAMPLSPILDPMDDDLVSALPPRLSRSVSYTETGMLSIQGNRPRSLSASSLNTHRRRASVIAEHLDTAGLYYTPPSPGRESEVQQLLALHQSPSRATTRRHSIESHNVTSPSSTNKLTVKNPGDRVRQRCMFSKLPSPCWKSRDFVVNKQGKFWTSHPGWHRILRYEYRVNGLEQAWREERNRFLQDFRRDRQFEKQSRRRLSNNF